MNKISIQQKKCLFTLFLTLVLCLNNITASGQNPLVTIQQENVPMQQVMEEIENHTKYLFIYTDDVDTKRIVTVKADKSPLQDVLAQMIAGAGLSYEITNSNILLSVKSASQGASHKVQGTVVDTDGSPLIGATVVVPGTSLGVITDVNGSFTLTIPADVSNPVLSVSYFGYETLTVPVGNRSRFEIVLKGSLIEIDETVVTALGIKRSEKALSYNVQQVIADDIVAVKDASFINALNGKVAGLNINSSSSGVGGASKVTMRGSRSISSSSNALYVIDGVPMYNGTRESSSVSDNPYASSGSTDMAADINPEDIESISVLTGAAAAALYGSSASNGAIIINTKRGSEGATSVTFTQNTEFVNAFVTPTFQNRYGTSSDNRNLSWGNKLNSYNYMGYDPLQDYFQTGVTTTETISLSTGNSYNQTYLSAAALNSEGIVPNSKYSRYNFTFRNTTKFLNDKMTLDVGASHIRQRDMNMTNQGVSSNPITSAYLYPRGNDWNNVRMFEQYDEDRLIYLQNWDMDEGMYILQNPYWINYRNLRENKKDRFMLNSNLSYKILDWLNVAGRVSIDNAQDQGTRKYYASSSTQLTESSSRGLYGESTMTSRQIYADVLVNINKSFGDDWSLNATLGTSIQDSYADGRNVYGPIRDGSIEGETGLPSNVFNLMQISSSKTKRELAGWREQMQSVFASGEVGFKGTYYLTATVRTDWPSQLAGAESMQSSFTYPSVGLSVVLSEMFKLPRQISYLKLRGSYANVGLSFQRFLANPTMGWVSSTNEWNQNTFKPVEDLKPEYTHSYEIGLTARFLHNFSFDFTWYNTNTINQLFNPQISPGSGYSSMYVQNGNVRNRGIELSAGYRNTWNKFMWDTNFAMSANRNKILKLAGEIYNADSGESTSYSYLSMGGLGNSVRFILQEGGTLGDLYTPLDLVRDHNGKVYVNENGNIAVDSSNKSIEQWTKLGSIFPKANLSWRNDFSYGNLNFGFLVTARLGGVVFSKTQAVLDYYGVSETSAAARDNGGLTINGTDLISAYNWYSVIGSNDGVPQYYTYDATNVRLQEASVGYTIPRHWLGNTCNLTVSLVGRNLFMFYNRAPFDPEATASTSDNYYQGIDYFMMPSTRNLGFSVRLKF